MVLGNIKEYTKALKEQFKDRIAAIGDAPKLAIIQVGNVEASNRYIKNKVKDCEEVGIIADVYRYPEDITEHELCENIKLDQEHYDGVIVQLPLPPHIREKVVVAAINPLKDVDGFHPQNVGSLCIGKPGFVSCTPEGIIQLLKRYNISIEGK